MSKLRYNVESDGKTVWVNASDGSCVGRFSKFGIDLHTSATEQINGAEQCLDCTHSLPGPEEWKRFCLGVYEHYGVVIDPRHSPYFLSPIE